MDESEAAYVVTFNGGGGDDAGYPTADSVEEFEASVRAVVLPVHERAEEA